MASEYVVSFRSGAGELIYPNLKYINMELARRKGEVGVLVLWLDPAEYDFLKINQVDARIVVERSVDGGPMYVEGRTVWFVRKAVITGGINKPELIKVTAHCANSLLYRRIVAYYPEELETEKEDMPVLDIILEMLHENLGADAIAARDFSSYLYIPPATTNYGPIRSISLAWRDVGSTIKELIETAKEDGVTIGIDIQYQSIDPLKLVVVAGRSIGTDRVDGDPIIIGKNNFDDWEIDFDYTNEQTYIYAGGEGEDDDRLIVEVSSAEAIKASPFNRVEGWVERSELEVSADLEAYAQGQLEKKLTRPKVSGKIVEGGQIVWGVTLGFGDLVQIEVKGLLINCVLEAYQIKNTPSDGDNLNIVAEKI